MKEEFDAGSDPEAFTFTRSFTFAGNLYYLAATHDAKGKLAALEMDVDSKNGKLRADIRRGGRELSDKLFAGASLSSLAEEAAAKAGSYLTLFYSDGKAHMACDVWSAAMQILQKEYKPEVFSPKPSATCGHKFPVLNGGRA